MFAMEKKAISVDQVKENFSINGEQAESAALASAPNLISFAMMTVLLK